jgi:hypothetical protein
MAVESYTGLLDCNTVTQCGLMGTESIVIYCGEMKKAKAIPLQAWTRPAGSRR